MNEHIVYIGPHESSADLLRRRPDLFAWGREGVEYIGRGNLTIVRQENPPAQYLLPAPLPGPLYEAAAIVRRALLRCVRGG